MSKQNDTQSPAITPTRYIGRQERDFLLEIVRAVYPPARDLSRDEIVGSNAKVDAFLELIPVFGKVAIGFAETDVRRARGRDLTEAAAWLTKLDETARTWRRGLELARQLDEAARTERLAAKKAKAAAKAPAEETVPEAPQAEEERVAA